MFCRGRKLGVEGPRILAHANACFHVVLECRCTARDVLELDERQPDSRASRRRALTIWFFCLSKPSDTSLHLTKVQGNSHSFYEQSATTLAPRRDSVSDLGGSLEFKIIGGDFHFFF